MRNSAVFGILFSKLTWNQKFGFSVIDFYIRVEKILKNMKKYFPGKMRYPEYYYPDWPETENSESASFITVYRLKKYMKIRKNISRFNAEFRGIRNIIFQIDLKPKIRIQRHRLPYTGWKILKNMKKYFPGKMRYSTVFYKLLSGLTWNKKIRNQHNRFPYSGWLNIKR